MLTLQHPVWTNFSLHDHSESNRDRGQDHQEGKKSILFVENIQEEIKARHFKLPVGISRTAVIMLFNWLFLLTVYFQRP